MYHLNSSGSRSAEIVTPASSPANPHDFMDFWNTLNAVLKSRGQDEMLYGEARGWFEDFKGWGF